MIAVIVFGGAFLTVTILFVITARELNRKSHLLENMTENRDYWFDESAKWHGQACEWREIALPLLDALDRSQQIKPTCSTLLPDNLLFMEAAE